MIKTENHEKVQDIKDIITELNDKISALDGVVDFEEDIQPIFNKFRNDDIEVSIESEISIGGIESNIVPYIKADDTDNLYPTSGDGRKKLLGYALNELLALEEKNEKVNIFLIEEPENNLHRSMQISLSKILFNSIDYSHLFISTHSPYILQEMDEVNLVRIYNENKIDAISATYKVPEEYRKSRKILNKGLTEAIFADTVLLVEGVSEQLLFSRILSEKNPLYEADGAYILVVDGIGFEPYVEILDKLRIEWVLKTDNDLRKYNGEYSVLGFSRINKYITDDTNELPTERIESNDKEAKEEIFFENEDKLKQIQLNDQIYLSKVDLENDLYDVIPKNIENYVSEILNDDMETGVIEFLQEAKKNNMSKLVDKLTIQDCEELYESDNFSCLKEVLNDGIN